MQTVSRDIELYYVIQLSCYWFQIATLFVNVRRKDFLMILVHHVSAIVLLIFSYSINLLRIGSLLLIVHDISDVFLEATKMFKYIKWRRSYYVSFATNIVVWITARLIIFPGYLLKQ